MVMNKSEESLQIAVSRYLKMQYPNINFTSESSGMRLTMGQAVKAKKMRSSRGLPDLMIFAVRGKYSGMFLELKKEGNSPYLKNGELRASQHIQEQNEVLESLRNEGYYAEFAVGLEDAINQISNYLKQQ